MVCQCCVKPPKLLKLVNCSRNMVEVVGVCEQSCVISTVNTDTQWPCWPWQCMLSEINLFLFIRTSVWDGTQMSTESRWRGWWGRNWSAGSRTIWCHRSATHSQPLLSAHGPVHLRPCPLTALTQLQMGAAMCDILARKRVIHSSNNKKELSIGNVPRYKHKKTWDHFPEQNKISYCGC